MNHNESAFSRRFFNSSRVSGRQIECGFSFIQRIGKPALTELWFPRKNPTDSRALFSRCTWSAVRQFELMQEAGNLAIEDLDVPDLNKALLSQTKMRAGGYRVVVVTMGGVSVSCPQDDLEIMDAKLQEEIEDIEKLLFLGEQSAAETKARRDSIINGSWSFSSRLPHVSNSINGESFFAKRVSSKAARLKRELLAAAESLPKEKISHDVAIGLAIPDAATRKTWTYLAGAEYKFHAY